MSTIVYIEPRENPYYLYPEVLSAINYNFSIVSGGTGGGGGSGSTTYVRQGSNITTGGTAVAPIVNVVASPSFNNLTFSGTGQFAITSSTSLSGGTLSGGTIYSGRTNLYQIFATTGNTFGRPSYVAFGNSFSALTGTSNFTYDGSSFALKINGQANNAIAVASTGQININPNSSTTYLANDNNIDRIVKVNGDQLIFREQLTSALHGDITFSNSSVDGLFRWVGKSRFASLSATTLSAGTLYSGTTNLYNIFQPAGSSVFLPSSLIAYGSNISTVTGSTGFTFSSGGVAIISQSTNVLSIEGSGAGSVQPIFSIQGSQGQLMTVTDSLSGSLYSINNISGLPVLEVFSDNTVLMGDYLAPSLNTTVSFTLTSGTNSVIAIPTNLYNGAFIDYTIFNSSSGARAGNMMIIWSGVTAQFTETSTNDIGTTSQVSFSATVISGNAVILCSASTSNFILKTIIRAI